MPVNIDVGRTGVSTVPRTFLKFLFTTIHIKQEGDKSAIRPTYLVTSCSSKKDGQDTLSVQKLLHRDTSKPGALQKKQHLLRQKDVYLAPNQLKNIPSPMEYPDYRQENKTIISTVLPTKQNRIQSPQFDSDSEEEILKPQQNNYHQQHLQEEQLKHQEEEQQYDQQVGNLLRLVDCVC